MQTTLDIDEALLKKAEVLASQRGQTVAQVLSAVLEDGLRQAQPRRYRNGIPLIPSRGTGRRIDLELVNRIRDEYDGE